MPSVTPATRDRLLVAVAALANGSPAQDGERRERSNGDEADREWQA